VDRRLTRRVTGPADTTHPRSPLARLSRLGHLRESDHPPAWGIALGFGAGLGYRGLDRDGWQEATSSGAGSVLELNRRGVWGRLMRRLPWLLGLAVLAAMSGCGADGGVGAEGSPGGESGKAEATSVTGGPISVSSASPPGSVSGSRPPAGIAKGEVLVAVDADHYAVGGVIHVSVTNKTDRPIYTEDFKTVCSIVILQRRDGNAWTDILGCRLGRPTVTVEIGPELGKTADLDPASFHLQARGGPAFGVGDYRVKFTYRNDPALGGEDPFAVYSAEFAVR
jgi:hypothetical protein